MYLNTEVPSSSTSYEVLKTDLIQGKLDRRLYENEMINGNEIGNKDGNINTYNEKYDECTTSNTYSTTPSSSSSSNINYTTNTVINEKIKFNNNNSNGIDNGSSISLEDSNPIAHYDEYTAAGLKDDEYYKKRLSPVRYYIRSKLLPLVESETPILYKIQKNSRSKFWDQYFPFTANFGSHTFYVLILPIPAWFGCQKMLRDLVSILGLGIYFTGYVKDYLCLPRPKSPPLKRITMSKSTIYEYGCPSSHTANATSVSFLLLFHLINNWNNVESHLKFFNSHLLFNLIALISLTIYYISMIFGRIYCGMHGFIDLLFGSIIGFGILFMRMTFGDKIDELIVGKSLLIPLITIIGHYSLIHFHTVPLETCPCFEDSVAFVGVLMGLDLGHWLLSNSNYKTKLIDQYASFAIPYSYNELGLIKSILRVLIGVSSVVTWKLISKPLLNLIFKPIFKIIDSKKIHKIKKNKYLIKFISNDDEFEFEKTIENAKVNCDVFKYRYNRINIIRLIIYAGIAMITVGCKPIFDKVGLGLEN